MNKNNFQIKKFELIDFLVVCLLFIGVFSFLYFSGTLNSGYHFIDDHEIIRINADLENTSFLETSANWLKSDLNIRFRPIYYLHRILEIKIFGSDFLLLSLYTGLLASLTFSFFYFGARKLKYSVLQSLIFVLLTFLGLQAVIWWRLGPSETIGMFFLGLSFLFMARCLDKNSYKINNILFIIFLIITSFCKESFVIVIPAFVLFKIWNEKKVFHISARESIKKNLLSILPVIIMFIELYIIKFVIGTNQIGYAGITSSANEFITGVKNIIFSENSLLNWVRLLEVLVLFYLTSFLFIKEKRKQEFVKSLKYCAICFFFSTMIVLPNILMHAKSGMVERYLLPTTLGLSFLTVCILQNTKQKFFRWLMFLPIFIFIVLSFNTAKTNAVAFANEGRETNELLSAIIKNASSNSKIILVADPVSRFEVSYSVKVFLSFKGIDDLYAFPIVREYHSDFERGLEKGWTTWFVNKNIKDINGQPDMIIVIDKIQSELFFSQNKISQLKYNNLLGNNSPYALYIKTPK